VSGLPHSLMRGSIGVLNFNLPRPFVVAARFFATTPGGDRAAQGLRIPNLLANRKAPKGE
jgi:hypothetical protein